MRRSRVKSRKRRGNLDLKKLKDLANIDFKKLSNTSIKKKTSKKSNKKRKVVAFDIGYSSIKIVEGTYYKRNLSIDKLIKIPTPDGTIKDGEIIKKDKLVNLLQTALTNNSITAKEGICTNNSTTIINRELTIPKVEDDEIDTVVRYEIQQYLPINLDDYVLQTNILGEEKLEDNERLSVRAIAYPEKMARGYYELIESLNLKPLALDVNYNALNKLANYIKVINEYEYNSKEVAVFIDMGATSLDVNIYNEGILQFTRMIKAGGINLDDILTESLDVPKDELEKYKKDNIDLSLENLSNQGRDIVGEIDEWIDKIEKVIQFYKNKNMGIGVNNIFIYGGTSKIKGLNEYMTSKLLMNVIKIESISKIDLNTQVNMGESIDSFINAIGSIIRIEGD
ncbi:pilus assembly protein PilM [Clostridium sp. SHJSY1]|uniref:pilus assembly protein PilM n=1 Tax=Clostridium sp. SHJSY1 TaxID=2942483 RepID=UPI0028752980|nr:pilus assembly protein PilM [Clostridium sp. SHJSY1]MDS0525689.1 pilus assembly protein PilM [Clostridium sp. SHJSY1]